MPRIEALSTLQVRERRVLWLFFANACSCSDTVIDCLYTALLPALEQTHCALVARDSE